MATGGDESNSFAEKCTAIVYNSMTCKGMLAGFQLGLFDTLAKETSENDPKTSEQIAHAANLKERYVREWLGTMVVSDIVDCDPSGTKFWMRKDRAEVLKSENEDNPMYAALFGHEFTKVYDQLVPCFKPDGPGGLSYANFTGFHKMMSDFSNMFLGTKLVPEIIPKVPGLDQKLEEGIKCLDVGCGGGVPSRVMGQKYVKSDFWGIDFEQQCIASARKDSAGLTNVHFEEMDAANLKSEWNDSFDFVSAFDSIHDQAYPDKVLEGIFRLLKSNGLFLMFDMKGSSNCYIDKKTPFSIFTYTASLFHCMPVSLYFEGGMGLGAMWGSEKAKQMLTDAGFIVENIIEIHMGEENFLYVCRKP